MNGYSRSLCSSLILLLSLVVSVAQAQDDAPVEMMLRLLISFGPEGHQIARVLPTTQRIHKSMVLQEAKQQERAVAKREASLGLQAKSATVTWVDGSGAVLLSDILSDPRLAHAPRLSDRQHNQPTDYSPRSQGVYLVTGPAEATELRLLFPTIELDEIVLPAVQWVLNIR